MPDLCTISDVKAYLDISGTTYDTLLTDIVDRVSRIIEGKLDRIIAQQTGLVEYRDGSGSNTLTLRNYPIISITSIEYGIDGAFGETIAASEYWVELERGYVHRVNSGIWTRGHRNHKITYDAGFATVPTDYEHAAVMMSARVFKMKDHVIMQSQNLKDGSITFKPGSVDFSDLLAPILHRRSRRA